MLPEMAARPPFAAPLGAVHAGAPLRVALIGNPNTGKTTLFNRLCRLHAKTSNFPGTTASLRIGRARLPRGRRLDVVDLPGLYALGSGGPEARVASDLLCGHPSQPRPDAVVVLIDAANLARNLVLVGEIMQRDRAVVVALNMVDLAERRGVRVDAPALARRLGAPVIPIVASTGRGVDHLLAAIDAAATSRAPGPPADLPGAGESIEPLAAWADAIARAVGADHQGHAARAADARADRLDRVLTHPVIGLVIFFAVMGGVFWSLFALAQVPMALIEATFMWVGDLASRLLPAGPLADLITRGAIGGVAGTVVFLPQIGLLFLLISLLEDTGYLARAAFVNDRLFRRFGLPGQAFVPLLTSHACAVPGILSARLIPNRRDRLVTILVAPFMSCSARLPVYVLLTSLLFAGRPALAGLLFAACYALGAGAAFASARLFGRTVLPGRARPLMLELPTYKRPSIVNALVTARDQGFAFLKTVGTVIVAMSILMWWLNAYPRIGPTAEARSLRVAASRAATPDVALTLTERAEALDAAAQQSASYAGRIGRVLEPVFRPLGYDRQLTIGLLTSFVAREAFVSTMAVQAGGSEDAGVVSRVRAMRRANGRLVFTPAASASALVFFVLAMQCLPTLAVTRRESGSLKYAALQFAYMTALAYLAAAVVFNGLRLIGVA